MKFRLLRKTSPDREKTEKSISMARERLKSAEKAVGLEIFNFAVLEAYMAMFHAARALLYKDGIQEKSHYAIYIYLKEKYSSIIPVNVINLLNIHRIERHDAMYGLEYRPEKDDAETALEDAKRFVKEIEMQLKP